VQAAGYRAGQSIVAAGDSVERALPRRAAGGKLIDQDEQRKVFGIGEKESAQASQAGPQRDIGVHPLEPTRDRLLRQLLCDRGVPALPSQTVVGNLTFQTPCRLSEGAGAAVEPPAAGAIWPVILETVAQKSAPASTRWRPRAPARATVQPR
jgi:hypothetical protein